MLASAPRLSVVVAALGTLTGCSDAPPALSAAGLSWSDDELLGLSAQRRTLLAELAAFGVAVSDSALDHLGEPRLRARARERLIALDRARRTLAEEEVDDDVLRARYLTEPRWELTVRHLLIMSPRYEDEARRAEARAKAGRALERIREGEPFPTVAAEVSEEPGAEGREGLLRPGREGSWVDEFWTAALALEPGEISPVVETEYGFHVLRLEDRRIVPFDEARPALALDVARMLGMPPATEPAPPPALELADALPVAVDGPDGTSTLARWEGGELTLDTARVVWASWPSDRRAALEGDDDAALAGAVEAAAAEIAAARAAVSAGLTVPEPWMEEARRDWIRTAEGWASLLGFSARMGRDQIREAARAALGATGQNAGLARDELHREAAGLIHHAYPIETAAPGGA